MPADREKESRNGVEPPSLWVKIVVVLVALGVIATGLYMAVTGRWVFEDMAYAEGLPARIVGGAVTVVGAVALVRAIRQWARA
ncbi:MAG TPA: hypothetical protein VGG61_03790 [Gemmataceae bacterium]